MRSSTRPFFAAKFWEASVLIDISASGKPYICVGNPYDFDRMTPACGGEF
jgi:hypothetical protein